MYESRILHNITAKTYTTHSGVISQSNSVQVLLFSWYPNLFYSHRVEVLGQGIGRLTRPPPIQVIKDKEKHRVTSRCPKYDSNTLP